MPTSQWQCENTSFLFPAESQQIVQAAAAVYGEIGYGFLEEIYHEALAIELQHRAIPFETQRRFAVSYRSVVLNKHFVADYVCYDNIIVELKALPQLTTREEAQLLNYLKASGLPLGYLLNFGHHSHLEIKRFANSKKHTGTQRNAEERR